MIALTLGEEQPPSPALPTAVRHRRTRMARDQRGRIVGDRDGDVETTGGERFVHGAKLDRAAHEADVRCFDVEEAKQARQQPLVGDVGEPDSKRAIGRPGVEARGLERFLNAKQRCQAFNFQASLIRFTPPSMSILAGDITDELLVRAVHATLSNHYGRPTAVLPGTRFVIFEGE